MAGPRVQGAKGMVLLADRCVPPARHGRRSLGERLLAGAGRDPYLRGMRELPSPSRAGRSEPGLFARFLGGSPLATLVKLALVSVLVGWVMSAFGWRPLDIWRALKNAALDLWAMGFSLLDGVFAYAALGAAVVLPAFLVLRLLSLRR